MCKGLLFHSGACVANGLPSVEVSLFGVSATWMSDAMSPKSLPKDGNGTLPPMYWLEVQNIFEHCHWTEAIKSYSDLSVDNDNT